MKLTQSEIITDLNSAQSLIHHYAAAALQGILAGGTVMTQAGVAQEAYAYALEMLAVRKALLANAGS
jgi:hypothetical protein